jgi:hypothetical protein
MGAHRYGVLACPWPPPLVESALNAQLLPAEDERPAVSRVIFSRHVWDKSGVSGKRGTVESGVLRGADRTNATGGENHRQYPR